jgi:hypothetical protein
VNTSLVREGTETSNGVVEGSVDRDGLSNHIFDLQKLLNFLSFLAVAK